MHRKRGTLSVVVGAMLLAAAGGTGGCVSTWSEGEYGMGRSERTEERAIEHVADMPVHVRTRNGTITLRTGQGTKASIDAKLSAKDDQSLALITLTTERDASGTLRVIADWPTGSKGQQACSITVTLPNARGLDLATSNGSIVFGGFSGIAEAETSNGSVNVTSHDGDARIETSNGAITADGVSGKLIAETSNGRVSAKNIGGPVRADSSNGSIDIALTDANPGPVHIDTSNSSITLCVGSGFAGELLATTSNGSVKWSGGTSAIRSGSSNRATFVFSGKGEASKVQTSNGSISIEQK